MTVRTERDGPVAVVTIDRQQARNAVDPATAAALFAAFAEAERESEVLATVLTGAGGTFCAGFDLKVAADPQGVQVERPGPQAGPLGPSRLLADRDAAEPGVSLSKPLIAAVEGHAVAGGLELALLADLRVASATAVFGVFCRRWGVPLIDGGTLRLPRIVGQGRALDMILTGRPVGAEEALAWGLANRLTPAGEALATAVALAKEIARFPRACMRADRASAYAGWSLELAQALKAEARRGAPIVDKEGRAGAARFAAGKGRGGDFERI
ncbi:MAG TPA: crotonase/enoyl-CoA hydratase family protein [Caulobacteraceae bacterium]|nr:crotonase/enoyl-CoA hydratase family protein [Caulobacteraceae bacterium]